MRTLHATYFRYVPAGGVLSSAPQLKLADDAVSVLAEGSVVEHILSDNPNPAERYEVGSMFTIKGFFGESDHTELPILFGGALGGVGSDVYTKTQGLRTLAKYDIEIGVLRPSNGAIILYQYTDLNFIPNREHSFKQGDNTYIAFELKSTATTDETIDNSAA